MDSAEKVYEAEIGTLAADYGYAMDYVARMRADGTVVAEHTVLQNYSEAD